MGAGGNFGRTNGRRSNAKIHKGRQDKHIKGTNNYNQQRAIGKNPSILTSNPSKLLKEGAGKGRLTTPNKEAVDYGRAIGKYYDITRVTIHYDNKIVLAKPGGFK